MNGEVWRRGAREEMAQVGTMVHRMAKSKTLKRNGAAAAVEVAAERGV